MGDKAHLFMCILLDIIQKSGYNYNHGLNILILYVLLCWRLT